MTYHEGLDATGSRPPASLLLRAKATYVPVDVKKLDQKGSRPGAAMISAGGGR